MRARPYLDTDRARWDEIVKASRVGHFMHRRAYMEYHSDRFVDGSLLVEREPGKVVAVFPASMHGDELVSHGGLTFGGIQTNEKVGAAAMLDVLAAIIEHAAEAGVASIRYKPAPHVYQRVPADEDLYALTRAGAVLARRDVAASIHLPTRIGYSKGRKQTLKKLDPALRVTPSTDFERFIEIENEALQRHGATAVHSAAELALLHERFPENLRLWLAEIDGDAVGGVVTFDTATLRHTQYIGATARGKELGAVDAITDHLIRDAENGPFTWFDFGISTEQQGSYLNAGLASNKEGYGARAVCYDHYDLPVTEAALAGLRS